MLILPSLLWREIEERTRRALPDEVCGLLIGTLRGDEVEVCALASAHNLAIDPSRHFEFDPLDVIAAEDGARAVGLSVVGAWHSHPRGPLEPSNADKCGHGGWLMLIVVPLERGGIELGAWRPSTETPNGLRSIEVLQPVPVRR